MVSPTLRWVITAREHTKQLKKAGSYQESLSSQSSERGGKRKKRLFLRTTQALENSLRFSANN
jgi:hypothetical protein